MPETEANPLVEALPPATDYMTYLTILEYNLSAENLPLLKDLLQDESLTRNIGWDLVHLLLPLLPASEDCLQTVAHLGNPREVLLKVTESLRLLAVRDSSPDQSPARASIDLEGNGSGEVSKVPSDQTRGSVDGTTTLPVSPQDLQLFALQFKTLLTMLVVLHPRIKTKYPSRFLSTSLQAVLAAFSSFKDLRESCAAALIQFVHAIVPTGSPDLHSESSGTSGSPVLSAAQSALDPAAQTEFPPSEDVAIQKRLLQAFVTFVAESYMKSLSSYDDISGVAWASRLQERMQPQRVVPGRKTVTASFSDEKNLQDRLSVVEQLQQLAQSLELPNIELLNAAMNSSTFLEASTGIEDDPPDSPSEISLSKTGSLFLFVERTISSILKDDKAVVEQLRIFPEHLELLRHFIGTQECGGLSTAGNESEVIIDGILALGLLALQKDLLGTPKDEDDYNSYLQTMSLISANCPSPSLRYYAHYITSTVLRTNPSDVARLSFIRDTLEHCPYESLKVSAVGWIKGETIEANTPTTTKSPCSDYRRSQSNAHHEQENINIFSTPIALETVAPFLFPDLREMLVSPNIEESWMTFRLNLSFYLAALNFYWLLLSAKHLDKLLIVSLLYSANNIGKNFIGHLRRAIKLFRTSAKGGTLAQEEDSDGVGAASVDLSLLEDALDRVEQAVEALDSR